MTFSEPVDTQVSGPEPTIGALVHDLSQQLPELIRSELRLAQAEVTEKGKRAGLGVGMFSVAGLLAHFGVAVLITTAILAGLRGFHRGEFERRGTWADVLARIGRASCRERVLFAV